jgi:ubiquinone/menaquinone biosynthesis C-methylase UbiE
MNCPICGENTTKKFFVTTREEKGSRKMTLRECSNCGVVFADDCEKDRSQLYGAEYAAWGGGDAKKKEEIAKSKKKAFARQLEQVLKYSHSKGKKLLDIGTGPGYLLECAEELGFDCFGTEISNESAKDAEKKFPGKIHPGNLDGAQYPDNFFDVVTMTDVLEHLPDPCKIMAEAERILKPGGYLLIISPNHKSLTRKLLGRHWFQYKYEHVFYFNKKSLKRLLKDHAFSLLEFKNNKKDFLISYYGYYFQKYSFPIVGNIFKTVFPILPEKIKDASFSNPITGEFIAIARKKNAAD